METLIIDLNINSIKENQSKNVLMYYWQMKALLDFDRIHFF